MNLTLVAPLEGPEMNDWPFTFKETSNYEAIIVELQRFRGRIYRQDNAIPASALDSTGRFYNHIDYRSWHIIARNQGGEMSGVLRLNLHKSNTAVEELHLYEVLERMNPDNKKLYYDSLQEFIYKTAGNHPFICEPGGWAVDITRCESTTGLCLAASAWALQQLVGGWPAIASATVKHKAAELLKLMGGIHALNDPTLSRFYDPYYRSDLEIIFFIPEFVSPRFVKLINNIKAQLLDKEVIMPEITECISK